MKRAESDQKPILDQAEKQVTDLAQKVDDLADKSKATVSLKPALKVLDNIEAQADAQNNNAVLKVVDKVRGQLTTKYRSGQPIPVDTTARQALDLKRGIGKLIPWDHESEAVMKPIVQQVYGAIDGELDAALPGFAQLNDRLGALTKVSERAESQLNNAGIVQRGIGRMSAHTGAMVGPAAVGAFVGGPAGAVAGASTPFLQEALTSPGTKMGLARGLNIRRGMIPLSALLGVRRQEDQ